MEALMDTNQLVTAIGEAVANARPAQEYCLLWGDLQINSWWSCMTKSEWSGWMQAIFGALAILSSALLAIWIANRERRIAGKDALSLSVQHANSMVAFVRMAREMQTIDGAVTINSAFEGALDSGSSIRLDVLDSNIRGSVHALNNIARQANAILLRLIQADDLSAVDWPNAFFHWEARVFKHANIIKAPPPEKIWRKILRGPFKLIS
ncbi:hypothetical protein [Comamonas sp. 4034]|uniref:hypothetical protein n=1 Tax=Comamonas sp. 4034 TaxID=3156455 RepID=UPI003D1C6CEE